MYIDKISVFVKGGNGGDGFCSFLKEKYINSGGPDGGDGGNGGNVYIIGNNNLNNLIHIKKNYKAINGKNGSSFNCTGKTGRELIIQVPVGTRIFDKITGGFIFDILDIKKKYLVAKGGIHGLGNYRFKNSIYQSPSKITRGTFGETRFLYFNFVSISDIGLLGFPNSGKSTFINKFSFTQSKISEFYFTTQYPFLGSVQSNFCNKFFLIDLPGMIKCVKTYKNYKLNFLHHISRVKIIFYIIDIYNISGEDFFKNFKDILFEIKKLNTYLSLKDSWLIINKIDLISASHGITICDNILKKKKWKDPVFEISALNFIGFNEIFMAITFYLDRNIPNSNNT